jgi:hypothetical protein
MRIRTENGIGIEQIIAFPMVNDISKKFEVDLMNDSDGRWNNTEIAERFLSPVEQSVPLGITLEFETGILIKSIRCSRKIGLDGMVDDQIDRYERIDFFGLAAAFGHGGTHCGEINNGRHTGKILQNDSGGLEGNFYVGKYLVVPTGKIFYVLFGNLETVTIPQNGFEENPNRVRECGQINAE